MAKDYAYWEKQRRTCDHCHESHQRYIKANSATDISQEVMVWSSADLFKVSFSIIGNAKDSWFEKVNLTRVCKELDKPYLIPSNKVRSFEVMELADWGPAKDVLMLYCEGCEVILREEEEKKRNESGERIMKIFYAIIIIILLIFFFG